jgi:hypothetical protein
MPVDPEKLAKLAASVRTGGKGSVRRKKKAVHKTATTGLETCASSRFSVHFLQNPSRLEATGLVRAI